jgi:hypothetical protein
MGPCSCCELQPLVPLLLARYGSLRGFRRKFLELRGWQPGRDLGQVPVHVFQSLFCINPFRNGKVVLRLPHYGVPVFPVALHGFRAFLMRR